jgi:shikimate kinase
MNPAPNLVLVGPMGAGKSAIGRRLAERFALPFVDSDREIELRTSTSVATIFECEGESGFRARERDVLATLLAGSGCVVSTGGGAVLDADTRALLRHRGYVVHLQVTVEEQLARLARDRSRPLLAGDDRHEVLHRLAAVRGPLYAEVADLQFDTHALSAADAVVKLGHALDRAWQRGREQAS